MSTRTHHYVSTACAHGKCTSCRRTCKFCAAPCECECGHEAQKPHLAGWPVGAGVVALGQIVDEPKGTGDRAFYPVRMLNSAAVVYLPASSMVRTAE